MEFVFALPIGPKQRQFHLYSTGIWEEHPAHNRLSEITPIYAAAIELDRYFSKFGYNELLVNGDKGLFKAQMKELLQLSGEAFDRRLPRHSTEMAKECDGPHAYDSAIAHTLWPYDLLDYQNNKRLQY